jgi:hypothetical protein
MISMALTNKQINSLQAWLKNIKAQTGAGNRIAQWITLSKIAVGRKEDSGKNDARVELYIGGSESDFGETIPRAGNIEYDLVPPTKGGKIKLPTPCLRISLPKTDQNAESIVTVANRAEELVSANPSISEEELMINLQDPNYLGFILEDALLSIPKQIGLVGELDFFSLLVKRAKAQKISISKAFACWRNGSRDFSNGGVIVEVKTAGGKKREHLISEITQLEPRGGENEFYVFSTSATCDSSGNNRLPDYVSTVLKELSGTDQGTLITRLKNWWRGGVGYDHAKRKQYQTDPYLSKIFAGELFAIRPASTPPVEPLLNSSITAAANAKDIQYRLDLNTATALSKSDLESVLDKLLA